MLDAQDPVRKELRILSPPAPRGSNGSGRLYRVRFEYRVRFNPQRFKAGFAPAFFSRAAC